MSDSTEDMRFRPNGSRRHRCRGRVKLFLLLLSLQAAQMGLPARAQDKPDDLSNRSLEDLMNIEVTSVSKKEQSLSRTAAAVFVITSEDIRRSGATNIPDLLRMVTVRLATLMGGRIWVESEPGRGSNFHFTSRFEIAPEVAPQRALAPEALHGLTVLVVDDNRTNRLILVEMLQQWGMVPQAEQSAQRALSILVRAAEEGKNVALLITDLNMPEMDGFDLISAVRSNRRLSRTPVLLLSSSLQAGERARSDQLGVAAYLTKPVQPSELFDAILAAVVGEPSAETALERGEVPGSESQHNAMKILLAEDNAVNRTLAIRLLERRGHTVVTAENGRQAVEAVTREQPQVVLMDVQMPEMDGLEAIGVIREGEKTSGRHLPIIALTAHAMKGDRERCLAAGADDYVTKPIRAPELYDAIERVTSRAGAPATPPAVPEQHAAVFDVESALARLDGDREIFEEVGRLFLDECPKLLGEIRAAAQAGDLRLLERTAHTLKGSSANIGGRAVSEAAADLEQRTRAGDTTHTAEQIANIDAEVKKLILEMDAFLQKATVKNL